jgi:hypothetical protein
MTFCRSIEGKKRYPLIERRVRTALWWHHEIPADQGERSGMMGLHSFASPCEISAMKKRAGKQRIR